MGTEGSVELCGFQVITDFDPHDLFSFMAVRCRVKVKKKIHLNRGTTLLCRTCMIWEVVIMRGRTTNMQFQDFYKAHS